MAQYKVTHKATIGELMPVLTEVVEAESHDDAVDIVQKMFPKHQILATHKGIFKPLKTWKFWMQPRNSKSAPVEEILVQGRDINEATSKAIAKRPGHIWLQHDELPDEELTMRDAKKLLDPPAPHECGKECEDAGIIDGSNDGLWEQKWTPTTREGEEVTLAQIVTEAIGTGSMCWQTVPTGIFDSEKAQWVAGGAIDAIERLIYERARFVWSDNVKPQRRQEGVNIDPQDLIKEQNTDAQLWALAFASQFDLPEKMDSSILPWFASAIETAKDAVRSAAAEGPSAPDPQDEWREQQILMLEDKLYLIDRLVEQQAPLGTDLANFRRRLLLLIRA